MAGYVAPAVEILNQTDGFILQDGGIIMIRGVLNMGEPEGGRTSMPPGQGKIHITHNALTSPLPYICDDKAFTFLTVVTTGCNHINFWDSSSGANLRKLTLLYDPDPQAPTSASYLVRPVILLCSDSEHTPMALELIKVKINVAMGLMQVFFEDKLMEHALPKRTFRVSTTVEVLSLPFSKADMRSMKVKKIWEHVASFILAVPEFQLPWLKHAAFLLEPCQTSSYIDQMAVGGGGLSLLGFNTIEIWPESPYHTLPIAFNTAELQIPYLCNVAANLKCGSSYGNLYCATMGALAHELGHIFGLGHSEGIMGEGYTAFKQFFSPVTTLQARCSTCAIVRPQTANPLVPDPTNNTLTHSSANILYFNKWFLGMPLSHGKSSGSSVHLCRNVVSSKLPLAAIEIRDLVSEKVIKSFQLVSCVYEMHIFKQDMGLECLSDEAQLFAVNTAGNTLKVNIKRSTLPNGPTRLTLTINKRRM